jgi:HK97 family phage major capsid protein
MAITNRTESAWIPVIMGSEVLTRVALDSVAEFLGARIPMTSNARSVPRDAGVGVALAAPGDAYSGENISDDTVTLKTFKWTGSVGLTDEDLHDAPQNIVSVRASGFLRTYNIAFDNAVFGVTGNQSDTIANGRPYSSVYNAVLNADSGASYTASANYASSASIAGTGGGYTTLNTWVSLYETSDFYDPARSFIVAHPSLKAEIRGITDKNGRPIFEDTVQGTVNGYVDEASSTTVPNLFGMPLFFSKGAKTAASASNAPGANPLLIVGNRDHLLVGYNSSYGTSADPAGRIVEQPNADVSLMMFRSRRAFHVGFPQAFSVLEVTS